MGISRWTLFSDFTRYFHFLYEGHDNWIIIIGEKLNGLITLMLLILLIAS